MCTKPRHLSGRNGPLHPSGCETTRRKPLKAVLTAFDARYISLQGICPGSFLQSYITCRFATWPGMLLFLSAVQKHHTRRSTVFIGEIYPHPVWGRGILLWFIKHLDPSLVTVGIPAFQEFFLHQIVQWL